MDLENCTEYINKVLKLEKEKNRGILLPTYSIYLLSFTIVILFVIVIILSYLLFKKRNVLYNIMKDPEGPTVQRNYSTQTSHESGNLKQPFQTQNDDHQSIHLRELKNIPEKEPIAEEQNKFRATQSQICKELKMYPGGKSKHNMIMKDQLFKICENELTKSQNNGYTTSLKDLHMLLHDKAKVNVEGTVDEKSASTTQLDEYYDELPNTRPMTAVRSSTVLDIPVYDCLPSHSQSNVIINDDDSNYLFPISNEKIREPQYINAGYRFKPL
ncbi:uncharacterized protein ACR2FA_000213 [Aphomia sociella]